MGTDAILNKIVGATHLMLYGGSRWYAKDVTNMKNNISPNEVNMVKYNTHVICQAINNPNTPEDELKEALLARHLINKQRRVPKSILTVNEIISLRDQVLDIGK